MLFGARFISCHARARGAKFSLFLSRSLSLFFCRLPFFFALVLRHRSTFSPFLVDAGLLGNYQSGSSDRKYPAHPPPFATCVRCVPPPPPPSLSTSHSCHPSSLPRAGISAAAAAAAIRSLTNLFDKSPRLIGLTTRPRLFFPSVKFTVVTKSLVVPPVPRPPTRRPVPFKFLRRHLAAFSSLPLSSLSSLDFRDISRDSWRGLRELVGGDAVLSPREPRFRDGRAD